MDPVTAPLFAAGITAAGQVLSAVIKTYSSDHSGISRTYSYLQVTQHGGPEVTAKQMRKIVFGAVNEVADLIGSAKEEILRNFQEQQVKNTVYDVHAQVETLKSHLNLHENSPQLAETLILQALHSLQVSLDRARQQLRDAEALDVWRYCQITGQTSLLSGFALVGIERPEIFRELAESVEEIQEKMLDELALGLLLNGERFPWRDLPRLTSLAGVEDLAKLYFSKAELLPSSGVHIRAEALDLMPFDIRDYKRWELERKIEAIDNKEILSRLIAKEEQGKNRRGLIKDLKKRIRKIDRGW